MAAVELSPKAVLRQQELGALASQNHDHAVAVRAYRRAVGLGRDSVYRNPLHYTGLAQALVQGGSGREAVKTLQRLRQDFSGDKPARVHAGVVEGEVLRSMGLDGEAQRVLRDAGTAYEALDDHSDPGLAVRMAKGYLLLDERDRAEALMREVVSNHHDDESLLQSVQQAFEDAGMAEDGRRLISEARNEVAQLNNRGVSLAKQGQLDEAIALFEQAAERVPDNGTVNVNAAQVLLLRMRRDGKDEASLAKVRQYLERSGLNAASALFRRVNDLFREVLDGESQ